MIKVKGKFIDGYVLGLRGVDLDIYIVVGILMDYECFIYEEGLEKL